jgi:dihydrofolate reductase
MNVGKVIFDISMSLDGFIAGPKDDDTPGRELQALESLHDWEFGAKTDVDAEVVNEVDATTGAIVMGRRMFDLGLEPWGDPPPFHKSVFVLTFRSLGNLLYTAICKETTF